jgi:4-hydroxyphenylpyruvate dioxygenase-like putative hemolysin
MDAAQHVHVDVPLGHLSHWTFYYKHHSDMDAPQYVHVDGT